MTTKEKMEFAVAFLIMSVIIFVVALAYRTYTDRDFKDRPMVTKAINQTNILQKFLADNIESVESEYSADATMATITVKLITGEKYKYLYSHLGPFARGAQVERYQIVIEDDSSLRYIGNPPPKGMTKEQFMAGIDDELTEAIENIRPNIKKYKDATASWNK